MRSRNARRLSHLLLAIGVVAAGLSALQGLTGPADADQTWAVTTSVEATRVAYDAAGTRTDLTGDRRVTVKVSRTTGLRGRQPIQVAWSGAHPTGGLVNDPTSEAGKEQEYPVVVMQCRGVDTSGAVPKGQTRLSPETCWTQNASERYFGASSQLPVWRADALAPAADREPVVGAPSRLPDACTELVKNTSTARWLPLRAVDGTVYAGGPDPSRECVRTAPESTDTGGIGLPSNTTYGITDKQGNGTVDFPVWTQQENATLGCSSTVRCSLVVVPIVGLSCDAFGTRLPSAQLRSDGTPVSTSTKESADASCRSEGNYAAGSYRDQANQTAPAVRGSFWWSASNWHNRVSVPLDFASTGVECPAVRSGDDLKVSGSVLLTELAASWKPTFCTTASLNPFSLVQQADFFALDQVEAGVSPVAVATDARAGGFTRPVVPAPLTVGGFAIAFTVDDQDGSRRTSLRLDARLVAKLLTESYPAAAFVRDDREAEMGDNPLNITLDPEFQALNPGVRTDPSLAAGATLQLLSQRADLIQSLLRWVDADPEARAFIDGTPDPWGMKVNPAFLKVTLATVDNLLRDTYLAPASYRQANKCYDHSPAPFLNLVANPQGSIETVILDVQYAISAALTTCNYQPENEQATLPLRKEGRQSIGQRFVLGLVPLSAAARYDLPVAALQTTSDVPAGRRFTDASGRTFVDGDADGLRAATTLLEADATTKVWALDDDALHTPAGSKAYPGTMPVYAAVPTEGLSSADAAAVADLVCYAVDPRRGLRSGPDNGFLPAGYLPLDSDNGLGRQRDFALRAVGAIRYQTKSVPDLEGKVPDYDDVCRPAASDGGGGDRDSPGDGEGAADGGTGPADGGAGDPDAAGTPKDQSAQTSDLALTSGDHSAIGSIGGPLLLLLALLAGLVGTVLRWIDVIEPALGRARHAVVDFLTRP